MDGTILGIVGIAVLLILVLARMPVSAALILVGFAGFGYAVGFKSALEMLQTVPYSTFASQAMSVWVIWFLVFGLCITGGLANDLFDTLNAGLKHCRAGMAVAAAVVCGLFGSITAFSRIGLTPLAKMVWPSMQKQGYSPQVSVGVIAAGFSLGIMLPLPNALIIIYGVITGQSIAKMFLCGIIPTIISVGLYIIMLLVWRYLKPSVMANPQLPAFKNGARDFNFAWDGILLFVVIIAGMFSGLFKPTEMAAISAVLALIFVALRRRLNLKSYSAACRITLEGTGWLFLLLLGTMVFSYFLTLTRLPYGLSEGLMFFNRYVALALILVALVLLSCMFEALALILLVVPVIYPLVLKLGLNPVWFGVIAMRCIGLGLMLPYGGINLKRVQQITGVNSRIAAQGVMPFVYADIALIILLTVFPQIVLLPLG